MDRRSFLKTLALASAATLAGCSQRQTLQPPNIVFILADDLGYPDLGCFGHERIKTPHLDRMASQGVKLTDFYVTCSVCTPSRSGFLTGRYPHRNGLYENIRSNMTNYGHEYNEFEYLFSPEMTQGLDVREVTIADRLKALGYTNGVFGKWDSGRKHEFLPLQRGFDDFYGFSNTGIDYWTHERYGVPSMYRNNQRIKEEGYATDLFKREAVRFIRENHDKPFFLYVPFNAPHGASNLNYRGAQAPESYVAMYSDVENERRARYYAAITSMDDAIGEILDTLEEFDLAENTLVIFTSDNGAHQNEPLRDGKGSVYEGGVRVPFIARWRGMIPPGTERSDFGSTLEMLPTFVRLAGGDPEDGPQLDGYDLMPVLRGTATGERTEHYWELRGKRAVRAGKWKWVLDPGGRWNTPERDIGELYDLQADPGETTNLAAEYPEKEKELREKWEAWFWDMAQSEPRGPYSRAYFDLMGFGDGWYRLD